MHIKPIFSSFFFLSPICFLMLHGGGGHPGHPEVNVFPYTAKLGLGRMTTRCLVVRTLVLS